MPIIRTRTARDAEMFALGGALAGPRAPNVTVNVEQQPNDAADAARLYAELREKAERDVVETIRVADTRFEAVVHICWDNMSDGIVARAVFSLNGARCEAKASLGSQDYKRRPGALVDALRAKIAETIASHMLVDALGKLDVSSQAAFLR